MSNTLTTGSIVRTTGNLTAFTLEEIDTIVYPFIQDAHLKVSGSINDYNILRNQVSSGSLTTRAKKAQKAETYYALSYAIIPLNSRTSNEGGFVQSIGFAESQNNLYSFDDAMKLKQYYENEAEEIMAEMYHESASAVDANYSASYVSDGKLFWGAV